MVSSRPVPWYDRPARPFPALVWLRARYPFLVPPSVFARMAASAAARGQRVFPVKAWQARRWAGG